MSPSGYYICDRCLCGLIYIVLFGFKCVVYFVHLNARLLFSIISSGEMRVNTSSKHSYGTTKNVEQVYMC